MTIYTVMGSTDRTEWISKSFTCERTAIEFYQDCLRATKTASSLIDLLMFSPDPNIIQANLVKRHLSSRPINYTLHVNELVTDAFMELTPNHTNLNHLRTFYEYNRTSSSK